MTLVLRPRGRGNWTPMLMHLGGQRAAPLLVRVGAMFELGGITWRVCEVRP